MQKKGPIFACEMKKKLFLLLFVLALVIETFAQSFLPLDVRSAADEPLHELRAVWLTTIGGLDWPHSYSQSARSAARQQKDFCDILDKLCAAGVNTVLLQTRIRATTIFPSDMEPWDGCLSGFSQRSPGYDALAFAIDECHKRGMKLHAWVVAIPVGRWDGDGCKTLRKHVPHLLKKIGGEGFMNPEKSGTADYLARFCGEIARRYDVDGIHLDYIRYPETWKSIADRDKGRDNITRIVKAVHDAVKAEKPWVMMSCSPVGKYADTKRQWSHGWNARDVVCQDAALWLEKGYMDALFPMMYFRGQNFYPFAIDWKERSDGKIIVPGLGIYFMDKREKDWPLTDITQEMNVLRQYGMGFCFFRSKFFTDNVKGLYDYTESVFSRQPSLVPPMTWLENSKPMSLQKVDVIECNDSLLLSWKVDSVSLSRCSDNGGVLYNVYGSASAPVDVAKADNLLMASYSDNAIMIPKSMTRYFAVTVTDRYGNESEPCQSCPCANVENEKQEGNYTANFFLCDGDRAFLDGVDIGDGQLVEIVPMVGNALTSAFVRMYEGKPCIDVKGIASGHYVVNIINRKGFRHRLGMFSIGIR